MNKKQIPIKQKGVTVAIPTDPNALRKLKITLGMIIGVFAFLLYAQSISFGYTVDDSYVVNKNFLVEQGLKGIPKILTTDYFYAAEEGYRGPVYRPSSLILFAIEWQFFPNNPNFCHFINVLLFTITCWLLFLVLCKLFEKQNFLFPFVCSLLYVTHPIHSEVVNNIKSLDEILCFLFGILSIFFILRSITHKFNLYLFLSAFSFFLSAISKETGVTFLIIIPITAFIFTEASKRKIVIIILVFLFTSAIYFLIRENAVGSIPLNTSNSNIVNSLVGAPNYLSRQATAFYVLLRYILLLIFPHPLTCDYNFAQIKVQTLNDFPAIAGILVNFSLGIYAIINLPKKSLIAFGIMFYFVPLSPVSNVFLLGGASMAERFMYIPSLGFCIILTYFHFKFFKTETMKNKFRNLSQMISTNSSMFILLSILLCLYSIKTFSRSMDWKNNLTIYSNDVKVSNNSATAHYFYGHYTFEYLYEKGKDSPLNNSYLDIAINELKKSISINPTLEAYRDLASYYRIKNDFENAILIYESIRKYGKRFYSKDEDNLSLDFYNFGIQLNEQKQFEKSLSIFDSAIKYKPDFSEAYSNKGIALINKGKNQEAIALFEKAISLNANNEKAYLNLGCAYTNLHKFQNAIEYLNKAAKMDSTDYYPIYFLGATYHNMHDTVKANQYLEKAKRMKRI